MGKIKSKRIFNLLVFVAFFSFFIMGVSQALILFSVNIDLLLSDTFLDPLLYYLAGITTFFFKVIKYLSIITLISSLVSLFIIFYEDFIKESSFYKL